MKSLRIDPPVTSRNPKLFSTPGIPPTLIPNRPVKNPSGRKIAATTDRWTCRGLMPLL
jgi:hypothetical protein